MPKYLRLILHETPGSRFSLIPGDFLSYGSKVIDISFGARTNINIGVTRKDMKIKRKHGVCKDYGLDDSQNRCYIQKVIYTKFTTMDYSSIMKIHKEKCANITKFCIIPQIMNIFNLNDIRNLSQCVTQKQYVCMVDILQTVPYEMKRFCPSPCMKTSFKISLKSNTHDKSETAMISMRYDSDEITYLEEYLIFDISDILVAIGGSLGLFLGFSFLQCGFIIFEKSYKVLKTVFC